LKPGNAALILGLAGALGGVSCLTAQNDSDTAGVAAAVRFQKAEDAAAARQARIEASGGEANSAARVTPPTNDSMKAAGVEDAIRFQRAEDQAAAREARIERGQGELDSADRMAPGAGTQGPRSASARKTPRPPQHNQAQ
jgi:hypothetical protein